MIEAERFMGLYEPVGESEENVFQPGHEPFNPDQGRDEGGKFSPGGDGGSSPPMPPVDAFYGQVITREREYDVPGKEYALAQEKEFGLKKTKLQPEDEEAVKFYAAKKDPSGKKDTEQLGYRRMNNQMRGKADPTPEVQEKIEAMKGVVDKSPPLPEGVQLFRGIGDDHSETLYGMKVGDVCEDKGFQSWTLNPNTANAFTGYVTEAGAGVLDPDWQAAKPVMRLVGDGATRGFYYRGGSENEMIINPSQLRVVRVDDVRQTMKREGKGFVYWKVFTVEVA